MSEEKVLGYINGLIENVPTDWLKLTTHRLDIYNEKLAKTEFLDQFEALYEKGIHDDSSLSNLPTAHDYIRLGHPLSSVLEFFLGKLNGVSADQVITFSSQTIPLLAVLRKNLFDNKKTLIAHTNDLPSLFDEETVKRVYGYSFEMKKVGSIDEISSFDGSVIYVNESADFENFELTSNIDFYVRMNEKLGSVLIINGEKNIPC